MSAGGPSRSVGTHVNRSQRPAFDRILAEFLGPNVPPTNSGTAKHVFGNHRGDFDRGVNCGARIRQTPKAQAILRPTQAGILKAKPACPCLAGNRSANVSEVAMRPQVADKLEVHEGQGLGLGANDHVVDEGAVGRNTRSLFVLLETELERRAVNPRVEGDPTPRGRNRCHVVVFLANVLGGGRVERAGNQREGRLMPLAGQAEEVVVEDAVLESVKLDAAAPPIVAPPRCSARRTIGASTVPCLPSMRIGRVVS